MRFACLERLNTRGGGGFCWARAEIRGKISGKLLLLLLLELASSLRKGKRGKRLQSFTMGINVAGDVIGKRENWIGLKAKMATFNAIIIVCITPSVDMLLDSNIPRHMCKKSSELNSLLFFPPPVDCIDDSIRLELKIRNLAWELLDQKSLTRYTPCFASCCNTSTKIRPNYCWL